MVRTAPSLAAHSARAHPCLRGVKTALSAFWTLPPGPFPLLPVVAILLVVIGWINAQSTVDDISDSAHIIAARLNSVGEENRRLGFQLTAACLSLFEFIIVVCLLIILRWWQARNSYVASGAHWIQVLGKQQLVSVDAVQATNAPPPDEAGEEPKDPFGRPLNRVARNGGEVAVRTFCCGCCGIVGMLPCLVLLLATLLLLLAAILLGALLASDAGCRWVNPILFSTRMDVLVELAYSNQSSLVDALAAAGVGDPAEQLALTNQSLGATDTAEAVGVALAASAGLVPSINATLGALAPLCVLVGELEGAAVSTTCTRLTVAIDLIVEALNGPPIRAGLEVNGTSLVSGVCEPASTLVESGVSACANAELLSASIGAAAAAEAVAAAAAAEAASAAVVTSLQQQVVSSRRAVVPLLAPLLEAFEPAYAELRRLVRDGLQWSFRAAGTVLLDPEYADEYRVLVPERPDDLRNRIHQVCHEVGRNPAASCVFGEVSPSLMGPPPCSSPPFSLPLPDAPRPLYAPLQISRLDHLAAQFLIGALLACVGTLTVRNAALKYNDMVYLGHVKKHDDESRMRLLADEQENASTTRQPHGSPGSLHEAALPADGLEMSDARSWGKDADMSI